MLRRPRISGSVPLPISDARSISLANAWAMAVRSAASRPPSESASSSREILKRNARLRGVTLTARNAGSLSATWPCSWRQAGVGMVSTAAMLKELAEVSSTATLAPALRTDEAGTRALRMPGISTVGTV